MTQKNFTFQFLGALLFVVLLFQSLAIQAQSFATKWSFPAGTTTITFNALTAGGAVNYSWGASPSGNNGSGSFTMATPGVVTLPVAVPAGNTVTIRMSPANLRRFYIANGPHRLNLIEMTKWGGVPWSSMNSAFAGCENFTIPTPDAPDLTNVTDMSHMFEGAASLNQNINHWNTAQVNDMSFMFQGATSFNQPLDNWNTAQVTNMSGMFSGTTSFNQNINNWNTAQVTDMSLMFSSAYNFNQPLNNWNTANVTNMGGMFSLTIFNQPIGNWNTGSVTNMTGMFSESSFNQPIGNWNTANVTDMSYMFLADQAFNQDISNWNTAQVTTMRQMFSFTENFNQPIGNWNTTNVTDMAAMFWYATSFNQSIGNWALNAMTASGLEYMLSNSGMDCINYSATLIGWNANNPSVTGLLLGAAGCKYGTIAAAARTALTTTQGWTIQGDASSGSVCDDAPQYFITQWSFPSGTSQITFNALTSGGSVEYTWMASPSNNTGSGSFTMGTPGAVTLTGLNVPAGNTVTLSMKSSNLRRFFMDWGPQHSNLTSVSQWGAVNWSSMNRAFAGCENFTITAADAPNLATVTDMSFMFLDATIVNQPIDNWNTAHVTNMSGTFQYAANFNQPLSNWNTSSVTNMSQTFLGATNFNQPIGAWNTANVTDMSFMFDYASSFNQPIGNWNTSNVTDMRGMFFAATNFNQPIGTWNTTNVTSMPFMFEEAISFNQPIGNWNTTNVTSMMDMFTAASSFNQPIGNWNTAQVTDMSRMFGSAISFNQPIGTWNTLNVTDMRSMFAYATSFNQDISNWKTAHVTKMSYMFENATSFNQSLGNWALNAIIAPGLAGMLSNSGLDCKKYSATLIGWRTNNPSITGLTLGADGRQYGTNAVIARNDLTSTQGWMIGGDSPSGYYCDDSGQAFITKWNYPAGTTTITFNALTAGGQVNYTWVATPSNNSGYGSFTMGTAGAVTLTGLNVPAGNTVTLQMEPTNLRRFYIDNGPHSSNLMEVAQWGAVNWSSMLTAFRYCENFTITATDVPDLTNVTDMSWMFANATIFNQPIGNWNTAHVTDMNNMFRNAAYFNQNINTWNTSQVTNMAGMFHSTFFNQPIGNWNTSNVTDMNSMFRASKFNQPIGTWNTGNVTNMSNMFALAWNFNQPIGTWNTAQVTDMSYMFWDALVFNQPIGNWNTGNVTNMGTMFGHAVNFNQPIGNWNTTNVTIMFAMFAQAYSFNQPIGNWNTAQVTNMNDMFQNATAFNQDIGNWNTAHVTEMWSMFQNATSFNQKIGNWSLNSIVAPGLVAMLSNSGMDCIKYSATLNGWRTNNPLVKSLKLGADGRQYGTNAVTARTALTNLQGWTISGDTYSGSACNEFGGGGKEGLPAPVTPELAVENGDEPVAGRNNVATQTFGQQNLQVYPNPLSASTALHVVVTGVALSPDASLRILDLQGRVVHQQTLSNQTDLQLNHLVAGVYLLEATDGTNVWHERIVLVE